MSARASRALAVAGLAVIGALVVYVFVDGDDGSDPIVASATEAVVTPAPAEHPEPELPEAPEPEALEVLEPEAEPIPVLGRAPAELVAIDGWFNTEATTLAEAAGDVTIVQFWTFGCHNCKATLPHLQAIYGQYADQGLEIVGVHAPEFGYEADPDNVAQAIEDLGVSWPVALDNEKRNFRTWQTDRRFWPRTYVVDGEGNIRFDRIGEGAYDELEETVARLLADQA